MIEIKEDERKKEMAYFTENMALNKAPSRGKQSF